MKMTDLIFSTNWDDKLCILIHDDIGQPVVRGENGVKDGQAPHKISSSGRVYLENERSAFPHVYDMKWIPLAEMRVHALPDGLERELWEAYKRNSLNLQAESSQ